MEHSGFTPGDSNTPWWYETPSLASQSSYGQSSFAGATISQLTDPFSMASDTTTNDDTASEAGSGHDRENSDDEPPDFLIPTVESSTGQSSFSLSSTPEQQKQKRFRAGHSSHSAANAENVNTFETRPRTFSDSMMQHSRLASSVQPSSSRVQEMGASNDTHSMATIHSRGLSANTDVESDWTRNERGHSGRGSGRKKEVSRRDEDVGDVHSIQLHKPPTSDAPAPVVPTTTSSNGVVNFTVNCQIHLHSENGELKRSNSNIELVPATGSHYPIMFPGNISTATGSSNKPGVGANREQMEMTLHSTITEEDSTDISGLFNQQRHGTTEVTGEGSDGLTPLSLSSSCSGESQLSHSMSSANQDILNYLRPQLMQYLDPEVILPLLEEHNLLTKDDVKYLTNPRKTEKEKKRRILATAPICDFDLFVECIISEKSEPGHIYLAKRMKEAIEKKRNNPFKRLSSLRHKGRNISSEKPPPIPTNKERERRHSPRSSSTPSPSTPTRVTPRSSLTTASKSHQKSSNKITMEDVPFNPLLESLPIRTGDSNSFIENGTFTLPRKSTSNLQQASRSSKPYSSARYASMSSGHKESKRSRLSRHSSFQGAPDSHVQVTPLLRDPNKLSEENSDVLENLTHFKTSVFSFPANSQEQYDAYSSHHYPDSFEMSFKSGPTRVSGEKESHEVVRDSQRRGKKSSDPGPYTTIPEVVAETNEVADSTLLSKSGKHRRPSLPDDSKSKYSSIAVSRYSSNATPGEMARRQQLPTSPCKNKDQKFVFPTDLDRPSPRHSSLRRESPKRAPEAGSLKRGMSLHGVTESPSRHYQVNTYDGNYMPSALSPVPTSPTSPDDKNPPPIPVKKSRTHRRTQSYDTSQTDTEFLTFSSPRQTRPSNYKNLSLRRGAPPSSMSNFRSTSSMADVPSHVPIISTQDSGITSSFNSHLRSASGYSLSTDPGSGSRSSQATSDLALENLTSKRFEWLQEKVRFKKAVEDIDFSSPTHYNQERTIINSGVLYEHGRPKFVVLLTDMLLILKPRKKASALPGRLGLFLSHSQGPVIDWFSDMECIAKMPLMLHHLSVRSLSKKKEPQVLYLHYDDHSEMIQFTLHSVSKEAKDIWVDSLNSAIIACTEAQAKTVLPVGNRIRRWPTSSSYTKLTLTIVEANNVAVEVDAKTRNHFCAVQLGDRKCKTPSVKAQCWPSWNYKFEFVDFALTETVWIEFYTERITSPDEFLGYIDIQLMAVAQRLKVNMSQGVSLLQLKNQHLPLKNGKGTLTLDFELGWENTSQ